MAQYTRSLAPDALKDKVIVLTGGANGIGASLVEHACANGAYVCFGDLAVEAGEALAKTVNASNPNSSPPRAVFVQTDVTNYESVLGLFDAAMENYGRIDHAVAGAGIVEIGNIFDPALNMESIRQPPTTKVLDVNLLGCLYVARIASVYLRQGLPTDTDRSIVLVSSVAGFKESPGLFVYQASKHGVIGLMRSLRLYLPAPAHGIRINCICPWMTATGMVRGIQDGWYKAGLPVNSPMDVAKITAAVVGDASLNGTSMYVEGGRAWEIEGNLDRLEPVWLGEEPSRSLAKGQAVLGSGMDWTK
ncbi:putative 3-hydroxyacyl-CoA dehydrogenase [Aspergillus lucknowensis]|uniref:3-hydroxyacyl-CoA dehydrogenase n=1 Tax=Aspergillus lucknowensis TaxID=176173 RepID=A0ABR4M3K2_9EURO